MQLSTLLDRNFLLRGLLAVGSSLLILALLFQVIARSGEEVNLASLTGVIRNTAPAALLIYTVLALLNTLLRALRYRLLLQAAGEERLPPFLTLYWITMVRNMAVDLFPSRLGELVYVAMLNRASGARISTALTSLLFATLLDVAIILPVVLAIAIWFVTGDAMRQHLLIGGLILTAALVIFLFGLKKLLPPVAGWLKDRLGERGLLGVLNRFLQELTEAIQQTMQQGVFGRAVLLTIGVRLVKYSALYVLFTGVVLPNFPTLGDVDPAGVVGMLISAEAGASLPVPAFMSFGSWEAGGLAALTVFGFSPDESILALLALHIDSQIIDYTLGALALGLFFLTVRRGVQPRSANAGPWAVVAVGLVLAAGITALVFGFKALRHVQYATPPTAGVARVVAPAEAGPRAGGQEEADGFVVWSSNRSGNHDIMLMELPSRKIRRVTTDPHTETFPMVSPDGRKIVFIRSHKKWQSLRDSLPWSVYLLDLETGEERLVAKQGIWPTWSADGRYIYYQRKLTSVVRHDLESGEEKVIYRAGQAGIPPKTELQTPSIHPRNGSLAVTFRKGARMIATIPPEGPPRRLRGGDACQLTWSPAGKFNYFVAHGGRMTNAIFIDRRGENARIWLDLPGEYSHEYFPRLSGDGRYLVFAASAGGHEHDTADYELFLWKVGADPASAARLTFHSGNDSWPDIYIRSTDKGG